MLLHEHVLGGFEQQNLVFGVGIFAGPGLDVSGRLERHVSWKADQTDSVLDETLHDASGTNTRRIRAGTSGFRGWDLTGAGDGRVGSAFEACMLVTRPNKLRYGQNFT